MHPLLALGFPGPKASATNNKSAEPAAPSTPTSPAHEGSTSEGGEPPSSSSLGRELAALRATVAELRGTVEHLREDLHELDERVCHSKKIERTCAAVLVAAHGRIAALDAGLGDVEGRLARAAERRPRKLRAPSPARAPGHSPHGAENPAKAPPAGPSMAEHLHGIARDLARARFHMNGGSPVRDQFPVMMNAIETCLLSGEKHAHEALAGLSTDGVPTPRAAITDLVSLDGEPSEAEIEAEGAAYSAGEHRPSYAVPPAEPTMQPPLRAQPIDPKALTLDELENVRELIRDVRPIVDDMWDAARDTGEKLYGHEERRAKIDEAAFRILQHLQAAEITLVPLRRAASEARKRAAAGLRGPSASVPPIPSPLRQAGSALHVPEGARAAVEHRVTRREASPVEVLHHLMGAESDPTLVGLAYTLRAQLGALDALIEVGADAWRIGHVRQFCERLADVLAAEIEKLDFEGARRTA